MGDLESTLRERGEETLRRLHRLVRAGYVPTLGEDAVEDAIFLKHLADGPPLILYGDGKVVAINGCYALSPNATDTDRIYNEDERDAEAFDCFVRALRKPNWWQRGSPDREKYIIVPGCMIVMIAVFYGIATLAVDLIESIIS